MQIRLTVARRMAGFSMLEFTNGISAMAMLAVATVSGLHDFFVDLERCSVVNELLLGLRAARIASNQYVKTVTVCPSADGESCDRDGNWSNGWIAFVDVNANGELDKRERKAVIARGHNDSAGRVTVSSDFDRLSFAPGSSELPKVTTAAATLCIQQAAGQARVIWIDGRGYAELHDRRPEHEVAANAARDFSHRSKECF